MLCGKELVNRFVGADMHLFCMHLTISYTGWMGHSGAKPGILHQISVFNAFLGFSSEDLGF